ncbi:MAG: autotransporter outer membrane beta-barrel domain-containing protein, partial [Mailhella sp.]|nr:autotransporter outer membrane beta-barrel domain-containing protein [Mailhella sp.]
ISGAVVNGVQKTNTVMQDTLDMATAAPLAISRIVMNDVRKRMGDLRSTKEESGVWMRWEGGKLKGDAGLTNDFNTIQVGADTKVGKNCRFGVAGAFTHGDLDHRNGEGENETFSFSAYGTWMADNGMFADVIARVGFSNTETTVKNTRIDLDNEVLSLSGEYGWRLPVCSQFFVEPQVELTYTYVSSADSKVQYATYDIDSVDSLIGRAGLVAGWNLPDDMGNVYARASVVREFLGDGKITGTAFGNSIAYENDGDDTWLEYGIGANIKLTEKTYIWADVERTAGADLDEEWRGTVGLRYSF